MNDAYRYTQLHGSQETSKSPHARRVPHVRALLLPVIGLSAAEGNASHQHQQGDDTAMDKCSAISVTCSLSCGSKRNARLLLHSFPLKFERSEISSTVIGHRGCVFGADLEGPPDFQCNSRLWIQVEVQEPALIGSKVGSSAAPIQRSTSEVRPVRAGWWRHSIGGPKPYGDAAPTLKGVELEAYPSQPLGVTLLEWIVLRYSWQGIALRAFYVQVGDYSFQSRTLLTSA